MGAMKVYACDEKPRKKGDEKKLFYLMNGKIVEGMPTEKRQC